MHATKCDSLRHNVELKNTGTKLYFFFYDFVYLTFKKRQNSVVLGSKIPPAWLGRIATRRGTGGLWGPAHWGGGAWSRDDASGRALHGHVKNFIYLILKSLV